MVEVMDDTLFERRLQPNIQIWPKPFWEADQKKSRLSQGFAEQL
jgi:hypothetical protein